MSGQTEFINSSGNRGPKRDNLRLDTGCSADRNKTTDAHRLLQTMAKFRLSLRGHSFRILGGQSPK